VIRRTPSACALRSAHATHARSCFVGHLGPDSPRAALNRIGVTVNGLAIDSKNEDLTGWYWENVITGAGAFVVTANDFSDYPRAIRLKLIRETSKPLSLRY